MTKHSPFKARAAGFTLIELMIVVAVVGILSMVAYPSYVEYVARGHRTQLKVQLQAAQQWMERRYSERYFYGETAGSADVPEAFADQSFVTSPPVGEGRVNYDLGVEILAAGQGYRITATRAGTMEADRCGNPTVDNLGVKGVVGSSLAADAAAECWR